MTTLSQGRTVHPPGESRWALLALEAAARFARYVPSWLGIALIGAGLVGVWLFVAALGGTRSAAPHLFYVPIVLGAVLFNFRGAIAAALVATIFAGPMMTIGDAQAATNWLMRGAMFVTVGAITAASLCTRDLLTRAQVRRDLHQALASTAPTAPVDPELVKLVPGVLRDRSFHPVFQPIYSMTTGDLIAVEALTRFDVVPYHPPDAWFLAADAAGLGTELEVEAVREAVARVADLPFDVVLSLNVSPKTLAHPSLASVLQRRAGATTVLELTEHHLVGDYDTLRAHLAPLRAEGVRVAVDDAGAGISSLQHIVELAPEFIKLDISLTRDVARSPVREALGRSMAEFAARSKSTLIVEGIETSADLASWRELGAGAAQGYFLGRPGMVPLLRRSPKIMALLRGKSD